MSSSCIREINKIMSPLTLNTSITNAKTTATDINQSRNGLLLETNKLNVDLQSTACSGKKKTSISDLKIRLFIFVEDSDGSRFNIFDSARPISGTATTTTTKSNQHINIKNNKSSSLSSSTTSPISSKLNNEIITRMVFGSFPMVVSNRTAIKVHSLKNSNKTMISNVFAYYDTSNSNRNNNKMSKNHFKCCCNTNRFIKHQTSNSRRESLIHIKIINENSLSSSSISKPIDIISKLNQSNLRLNKTPTKHPENQHYHQDQQQQQSLSSSDVDSANISLNQEIYQKMSPCSSAPTFCGSYSGIYKRLMRSLSNTLINSYTATNTTLQSNDFSTCIQNGNKLPNNDESINELDTEYDKVMKSSTRNQSLSVASTDSFTTHFTSQDNNDSQMTLCDKCVEQQQCYPKYKIGIAVLFCLPSQQQQQTQSFKIQPSTSASPNLSTSSPKKTNQLMNLKNDPLILFPSLPASMPPSPIYYNQKHHDLSRFNFKSSHKAKINKNDFYEFIFSHLPLIEYQIKELKEKIIQNLPLYFNSSVNGLTSAHSSLSLTSSIQNESNLFKSNLRLQFSQKIMCYFEEYEKNFYLLYASPRLTQPAWLTIINKIDSKFKTTNKTSIGNQLKQTNTNITQVCNSLINDFVYLNKTINPFQTNNNSTPQAKRFFANFRQTFSMSNNETKIFSSQINSSFLSVLLSTVLKHHLSWVFTVLPSSELVNHKNGINSLRKQRANWTQILEKTNPYNPLWAQLGDLHGAINHPLKLVRTVLVGKNKDLIERLLFLLSYFIRCSNSNYFDITAENFDFDKLPSKPFSGQVSSSSSSTSSASSPNLTYNNKLRKNSSPLKMCNNHHTKLNINLNYSNESDLIVTDLHLESEVATIASREVNVYDVNSDPVLQLNAGLSTNKQFNSPKKDIKSKKNDDHMVSMSSSSSIASPSSCSISSSPLNHSVKMNKIMANINYLSEINYHQTSHKQCNLTSNSIGENCTAQELPLIGCQLNPNIVKSTGMLDNFGYSLLASYCDEFVFEFVLHGTSDKSFINDLYERLQFSKVNSIIDCKLDESVYIVVDVDEFDVRVYSSESPVPTHEKAIPLVNSLLQSVLDMIKLFQNSEFVLLHLEDKLQELLTKAITLNQLKSQLGQIDDSTLINLMELSDSTDLDFLTRIFTAVYFPNFEI